MATIEARIRYLTTEEGGRRGPVGDGYRGQFHYENDMDANDGFQCFPDLRPGEFVPLGCTVRAWVLFPDDRWREYHSKKVSVGMRFDIREGSKLVGQGVVTRIDV